MNVYRYKILSVKLRGEGWGWGISNGWEEGAGGGAVGVGGRGGRDIDASCVTACWCPKENISDCLAFDSSMTSDGTICTSFLILPSVHMPRGDESVREHQRLTQDIRYNGMA